MMPEMKNKRITIKLHRSLNVYDINYLLLYCFTFFTVFTPVDVFHMKKITLAMLLMLNIKKIKTVGKNSLDRMVSLFGLWLTILSIIISSFITGDIVGNIVQGYMGLILLLYYPIVERNIDYKKIFEGVLLIAAYFTVVCALLDIVGIIPMSSNPLLTWMRMEDLALVGKGGHLPTGYMIFLKTCPLFVLILPTLYSKKMYIETAIVFLALLISGTRANIMVGAVAIVAIILTKQNKTNFEKLLLSLGIIVVIYSLASGIVTNTVESMFELKTSDDAVRTGTLTSILQGFKSNPLSLTIGSGYTSSFYNLGRRGFSTIVELSYWNLLRQVGLLVFIPMMVVYIYPIVHLLRFRQTIPIVVSYIGYLVIAYTDPLLYSTTGMIGLLYIYYMLFETKIGI